MFMVRRIYSFDIFDTLVMRSTANPDGIFMLMQNQLYNIEKFKCLPSFLTENFVQIRKESEAFAVKNALICNGFFDCTIEDIYRRIQVNYDLSDEICSNLIALEIEIESKNLFPIKENMDKIKSLYEKGEKVILISDMYLTKDILRKFLSKFDNLFNEIEIYVSSDTKKRKSNGSIYRYLKEKYHDVQFIHCGDNKFSDFIQAKWNKFDSVLYKPKPLKSYEKYILDNCNSNLYSELTTGISKCIRENSQNTYVFDFGFSFSAPLLFSYVNWVIEQALFRNFKNLYFILRDGYVLKLIADIIIKKRNLDIKTHYFYSSRQASRFADEDNINEYIDNIFSEFSKSLSLSFLSYRFVIELTQLVEFSNVKDVNHTLSSKERNQLKQILLNSSKFKELIILNHKQKKNLFIEYIKQETDLSSGDFAFVELNGSGRTQDNLAHLISNIHGEPVYTFYYNLQSDSKYKDNSKKIAFLSYDSVYILVLELLCRSDFGQTVGYKKENDRIVPVLEYEKNTEIIRWGFEEYIQGITAFTDIFVKCLKNNKTDIEDREFVYNILKFVSKRIDKRTAEILGSIPFGIYGNEKTFNQAAQKYTIWNLFSNKTSFKYLSAKRANFPLNYILEIFFKLTKKTNFGYISKKSDIAYLKFFNYKINIRDLIWKN